MARQKEKRKWQPRELRLVSEFLNEWFPDFPHMLRVRLGRPPRLAEIPELTPEEEALLGVWRRWVDAIVIMPSKLILIEVAIRPDPGDISKLELYERLVPFTPELEEFIHLPVEKWLVYAVEDAAVLAMAEERGIVCVEYRPAWIEEYLRILYPREREKRIAGVEAYG